MCNSGAQLLGSFQTKVILFVHSVALLNFGSCNIADLIVEFALQIKRTTVLT